MRHPNDWLESYECQNMFRFDFQTPVHLQDFVELEKETEPRKNVVRNNSRTEQSWLTVNVISAQDSLDRMIIDIVHRHYHYNNDTHEYLLYSVTHG